MSGRVQKVMIPPINFVFKLLQQHTPVEIWLFEQVDLRIEGQIRGFDEFMNIILDDAVQIDTKQNRREIGRILLKGDNITLIRAI
ncbi:Sm snRNP core protein Sme1 [Schizosaccharomyces osmophilus]|uniref:Small nuclear ribonucleoprotein E n=2 Tax=Schizosaccharomyces TaxID=4895 RepID=S9RJ16_SCHOY|nr:Sm snRNP core protein Sme1 [Schizosaccharomyces octosporus yFS286]XP_056037564.1 Sm snRNP core protein Sme1 [Schizosaccharomyces osmophilus]EPX74004.1 Sm snRNP core protein Sme1 [Schizosaccharomyces octosporus yFS286]WBW73321.1 Sm snRNP core protein Sme1 [Schizosaccharomyces osmophilus]